MFYIDSSNLLNDDVLVIFNQNKFEMWLFGKMFYISLADNIDCCKSKVWELVCDMVAQVFYVYLKNQYM